MESFTSALPGALAELLRGSPMSPGKLEFAWKAAVGPALERVTSPRLEGKVVVVRADTPEWARAVSASAAIILRRLQTLLGEAAVSRIDVRVG